MLSLSIYANSILLCENAVARNGVSAHTNGTCHMPLTHGKTVLCGVESGALGLFPSSCFNLFTKIRKYLPLTFFKEQFLRAARLYSLLNATFCFEMLCVLSVRIPHNVG